MAQDPTFKVGDVVEYELSKLGYPRWSFSRDYGGSGIWERNTIIEIIPKSITMELPGPQSSIWYWPLPEHSAYSPDQWERPGYLRHHRAGSDGPAIECSNGHKEWYQNDKLHRLNGPAIEYSTDVPGSSIRPDGYVHFGPGRYPDDTVASKCTCGAHATSDPNCHSNWCDLYQNGENP